MLIDCVAMIMDVVSRAAFRSSLLSDKFNYSSSIHDLL